MPHLDLISLSSWVVIGGASLTVFYVVSLWVLQIPQTTSGLDGNG